MPEASPPEACELLSPRTLLLPGEQASGSLLENETPCGAEHHGPSQGHPRPTSQQGANIQREEPSNLP